MCLRRGVINRWMHASKKKKVFACSIVLLLAILLYIPFNIFVDPETSAIPSYILLLTLVAVFWYSLETHSLREISAEHLELSFKPHLLLLCQDNRRFYLYNIGNGPAIRIRIDDAVIEVIEGIFLRLRFTCPPILKKDEYRPIGIDLLTEKGQRKADSFDLGFLTPPTATKTIFIMAHFYNMVDKEYQMPLKLGEGMDEGTSIPTD